MWDRASSKRPICSISAPPNAPAKWLELHAQFEKVVNRYLDAESERDELVDGREAAIAEAKGRMLVGMRTGEPVGISISEIAREFDGKIVDAEARIAALAKAVDEVGNTLAAAEPECRPEWEAANRAQMESSSARWHAALAELRAAAADYGVAANAIPWFDAFDPIRARAGDVPRLGSRVNCDTSPLGKNEHVQPVQKVIDLLAGAL